MLPTGVLTDGTPLPGLSVWREWVAEESGLELGWRLAWGFCVGFREASGGRTGYRQDEDLVGMSS